MSFWYQNGVCSSNRHSHRRIGGKLGRGAAVALSVFALSAFAQAQDSIPPGFLATFDFTQRLEYSDNPDFEVGGDPDFFGRTILAFGLDSRTRLESFSFDVGTDIEQGRNDQDDLNLTNTFTTLRYDRNTRNALLGFGLRYRESDTSSSFFDDDFPIEGGVITQDDGTRRSYGFDLVGEVGREAPVGASFRWRYDELNFSGTSDPGLRDESRNDLSAQVDFRISPLVTASLTGLYTNVDTAAGGVDRETIGAGGALLLRPSQIWTVDLGLSYDRIERSGAQIGTDEGLSGSIDVMREMPNGEFGLRYSSDVTSNANGRRSALSVRRDMELPRGALFVELGVTGSDTIGTDPLIQVSYQHIMPTSTLTFDVSQVVNVNTDNDEEINSAVRASYDRQINSLSSFGFSFAFFDNNQLQAGGNDGQRFEVGLNYRRDLTRDWSMVGGFSHTFATEDASADRRANTVFVGLERSFNWSP